LSGYGVGNGIGYCPVFGTGYAGCVGYGVAKLLEEKEGNDREREREREGKKNPNKKIFNNL